MCTINLKVIVSMSQSQLRVLIKSNQWGWWWQQLLNNYLKSTLFLSHMPLVYSWIVNTIRCSQSCIKQLVFTLYIKCALRQYYIIYNIQHCINTNYIYIFIKCSVSLDIFILSVCSTSQTDLYICHIFQPFALTIFVASHLCCLIFILDIK